MPRAELTDPATPLNVQPVGQSGWGDPVLSEEFKGEIVVDDEDLGLIHFREGGPTWATWYPDWPRFNSQSPGGNHTNTGQGAYYDTSKVSLDSQTLILACDKQTTGGLPYTAGMISSKDMFEPSSGYFEIRARYPSPQQSQWGGAWMSNAAFNLWPPEIDWIEYFAPVSEYLSNVYYTDGTATDTHHNTFTDITNWHVYGVAWTSAEADGVKFYRDGVLQYTTKGVGGTQYLMLNNGVEGTAQSWASAPIEYDYLRVWAVDGEDVPEPDRSWHGYGDTSLTPYTLDGNGSLIQLS